MMHPLSIDLPPETRKILGFVARVGVLGGTSDEVAAYLIIRGLDDLLRSGAIKLGEAP